MLSLKELKKAGFTKSGIFHSVDDAVKLTGDIQKHPGIYLLVVGGKIRYVGKTERPISSRLKAYENGLGKDISRRIVHTGILESIKKNNVEIYTLRIDERERFFSASGGLPVDYLVGLEAGLIENLGDELWNPSGAAGRAKRAKANRDL